MSEDERPDRDKRGRGRDDEATKRDIRAAIRDGVTPDEHLSERERESRRAAREDREAAATDRRESASDRRAAKEARDASKKSGD